MDNLRKVIPTFTRQEFTIDEGINSYLDMIIRQPLNNMEHTIPIITVSKQYSLIQHHEVIDAFSKGLESIGLEVMWDNADLILSEYGERMQLSFTIPNYDFNPGDGNPIILKINCLNSVDKSTALEIKLSWYRLVCKNGMIFADDVSKFHKIHLNSLTPEDIADYLETQINNRSAEESLYKTWYNKPLNIDKSINWVDDKLTKEWGQHLAARTLHILCTGYDGEVERSNEKVPTHNLTVKSERRVPGQPTPSNNIFNVSQALSWLAGHRTSIQDRLEKTMQIPDLIDNLIKIIN